MMEVEAIVVACIKEPESYSMGFALNTHVISLLWGGTVVVVRLCPPLCNPIDCSTPSFPVLHYLLEFAQSHVH